MKLLETSAFLAICRKELADAPLGGDVHAHEITLTQSPACGGSVVKCQFPLMGRFLESFVINLKSQV